MTCNPTSAKRLREATYSRPSVVRTRPRKLRNPGQFPLIWRRVRRNGGTKGTEAALGTEGTEGTESTEGIEGNKGPCPALTFQPGRTADGPAEGVPAPQPVTTVTCVDPSDSV